MIFTGLIENFGKNTAHHRKGLFIEGSGTYHKIEVKGNCTACGKTLGENDGLFLCAECQKKNSEG